MDKFNEKIPDKNSPPSIPANFQAAHSLEEKVLFAVSQLERGSADEIVRRLEDLDPAIPDKPLIAETHQVLTELHDRGLIIATEDGGTLRYTILA
jgi:hypothetical protein